MERLEKTAVVILGNQLFKNNPALNKYPKAEVVMIEADNIFSKRKYHKHKIMLIMLAMRNYRDYLIKHGLPMNYVEYKSGSRFLAELKKIITSKKITKLVWVRTADKGPNKLMQSFCSNAKIEYEIFDTEQFVTPYSELKEFFSSHKSPIMDNFYRWQRKRMGILMDGDRPTGGQWSYDSQNRKPLPKQITIPMLPKPKNNNKEVVELVDKYFKNNPGSSESFWLPTSFAEAENWLNDFMEKRFSNFGAYEDAMKDGEPFLFHSVLSPLLNIGLLIPARVIEKADQHRKNHAIPLNSFEGFIRQIIGWREYMYGMYEFNENKIRKNFFVFTKELEPYWYEKPNNKLPLPVRSALKTTFDYGYNHHIERLMVLGNWFLLNEYNPASVYEWFSSMYIDAYEWVMVPNVYAMSQYADGGFLATKPYISGGNYLQKMGKWWDSNEEAKNSEFTELYWRFVKKQADRLKSNPRMSLAVNQAKKR